MEKTIKVEKCLFDEILDDVWHELADLAFEGEIPKWSTYDVEKIENVYPIKDYHASLHEGPVEAPGKIVANVYIHTIQGEDVAEVTVNW